jgi:hypothetical protein
MGVLTAALCWCALGQTPPGKDAPGESKGIPPRATPADYQARAQAGEMTIGAEFTGHALPTEQGALTTEEYVAVEVGLFGKLGARVKVSAEDFSLRINGKKAALPSQPYGLVTGNLKDPEWGPPAAKSKSKTGMTGGGDGEQGDSNEPPAPVVIPIEVQRAMAQRVRKAVLPEGERALPLDGLIFFQYRGKAKGIHKLELIYAGPAGKATLALAP